jgi:hypothetical protein
MLSVRTLPTSEYPFALNNCASILLYPIGSSFSRPKSSITILDHMQISSWLANKTQILMTFTNSFEYPIELYWQDEAIE